MLTVLAGVIAPPVRMMAASGIGGPPAADYNFAQVPDQEHITVLGVRPRFQAAPMAVYGNGPAPWEIGNAIRDTMTGADTTAFGNAYNLGNPMGSDERSNETGGQFIAPRHN